MSASVDQTLVMLTVIGRCMDTMIENRSFVRVDIQNILRDCSAACDYAGWQWPGMSNKFWTTSKWHEFAHYVHDTPDRAFTSITLICMCDRIIVDLIEREAGLKSKIAILEPILVAVRRLHDFCDPAGANFLAFDQSSELLDVLYKMIGFVRDGDQNVLRRRRKKERRIVSHSLQQGR